jgi:tetratricopeptide (TPR) repeat protein
MTATRSDRTVLVTVALVAAGAYAVTAGYEFVYDDVHVIQNKTLLHSLANWREILRTTWWGYALYRPLTELSFAVDWAVSGGDPRWFHVVNVLLHATATALVFLVARWGLGTVGAGAAALAFAVHPVHVEAVANVVGRAEVLAACCALAAVCAYRADGVLARKGDSGPRRWASSFGSLAALGAGLAAKETAFAIPGLFLLSDWFDAGLHDERWAVTWRRHAVLWAAAVVLALEWLWVRASVLGDLSGDHAAPGLEGEGLAGRVLVMAPVVLEYLRLLWFPARLSADYSPDFLPAAARVTARGLAGLVTFAALVWLAVRARRRAPVITLGLTWIGGTLLILSNIVVPTGVLLAERTLYLPSVGAVLLLGWLVAWTEASWRRVGVALAALAVAAGLVRMATRLPAWRDNNHFFPQLVRDAPGSYRSYLVAGALAYDAGDRVNGESLLRRALVVYPLHPVPWVTLAYRFEEDRRWAEAARYFRAAFLLDSMRLEEGARAAVSYVRAGLVDSAESIARRMGDLNAGDPRYLAARAEIALARGRPLEAMTWRRRQAWQFPLIWQYWALTADAALQAGYCWEALRSITRVRERRRDAPGLDSLEQRAQAAGCRP